MLSLITPSGVVAGTLMNYYATNMIAVDILVPRASSQYKDRIS